MDTHTDASPTKVAIIGGGCAGLTAAFELTRPEHAGKYAVTVYQMGWRLGGKGASGRGASGRIEEHGLHLWMGYYENAFRLMRECYAELHAGPEGAHSLRFEDAFLPAPFVGAMDWTPKGTWSPWKVDFPPMPGMPGDPNPPRLSIPDCLAHAARLLGTLLKTLPLRGDGPRGASTEHPRPPSASPLQDGDLAAAVARFADYGATAGLAVAVEAIAWLELALGALPLRRQEHVWTLLDMVSRITRAELTRRSRDDDSVRRIWEVAELILATIRGCVKFRIAFEPRGLDVLDEYDCRDWLKDNGASPEAVNSAFIRALYDLAFAFEGGDTTKPRIAAGAALRGAFRAFFTYRGAFFWKLGAGMGDVVFAPLYRVLSRRGVRFEFFHKLTSVGLSTDRDGARHVASLEFDVQARTVTGEEYLPLVTIRGLPCWPSRPDYAQLRSGADLDAAGIDLESQWDRRMSEQRSLRVEADFDCVVVATGLGVVPYVCDSIVQVDEHWQKMLEKVTSVPTQAFQLWLDRDMTELGWTDRPINVSGFVEPFDTWADMTHVAAREEWSPKAIAYFCNVLEDRPQPPDEAAEAGRFVAEAHDEVRGHCITFLNEHVRTLWPASGAPDGGFDWSALSCPDGTEPDVATSAGPSRFGSQYWTANVRPSDRYTQCLPGSTRFRISPLDATYDNLTVAGDWTSCSLNMGCVEAAVMSGMLAAHALSGIPKLADIVGYDHP